MTSLRSGVKLGLMKKLSLYIFLVLMWCNVGFADAISEYEVAGAKLGKSILEIMSRDQLIENIMSTAKGSETSKRYIIIKYVPDASKYQNLEFNEYYITMDTDDENLPIVGIGAIIMFKNDFDACVKRQNQIANKFEKIFKIKKEDLGILDISEKYGEGSKWRPIIFEYRIKRNTASVLCYHYADQPDRNNIKVTVHTRKYADYITVK